MYPPYNASHLRKASSSALPAFIASLHGASGWQSAILTPSKQHQHVIATAASFLGSQKARLTCRIGSAAEDAPVAGLILWYNDQVLQCLS